MIPLDGIAGHQPAIGLGKAGEQDQLTFQAVQRLARWGDDDMPDRRGGIGHGVRIAPRRARGYVGPMRIRLEFTVLLAGWLLGFASALSYVFGGA